MMNHSSSIQIAPKVLNILAKQQAELVNKPVDGVVFLINQDGDVLDMQADIIGPVGTAYQGGIFRCKLVIDSEFPQKPPKGYFLTKIFHPNVAVSTGEICVNTLKKDWNPSSWSLTNIFEVIKCLLIVPFPESSLNEEAGREFMENYDDFFNHAKVYTSVHARPTAVQQHLIEKHLKEHYLASEEAKKEDDASCKQGCIDGLSSTGQSQFREQQVLSQVTNSFIPASQESKGEILGQIGQNQGITSNASVKPTAKKATAAADSKKKWMRRI